MPRNGRIRLRQLLGELLGDAGRDDLDSASPQKVFEPALPFELAEVDDRHAIANPFDLAQLVARNEDRASLVAELQNEVANLCMGDRVEATGGLVQEQQLGIVEKALRQPHPLLHTLRILRQRLRHVVVEVHLLKQGPALLVVVDAEERCVEAKKLQPGHVLVVVRPLRKVTDHPMNVHVADLSVQNERLARGRVNNAQEHFDGGRLPGPVWTEEPEDLAFFDLQIQLVNDVDFPSARLVRLRQLSCLNGSAQWVLTSLEKVPREYTFRPSSRAKASAPANA
ncbi:MAG: hypothetical protein M5U21_03700 [Fimbriimonadaceae bacterium]|nr:hypothetical protein [Fimbriimonadaceae bacterium]